MPTKPTKGDHGNNDQGSSNRGNQKATTGSAVSPEVAEAQREAITGRDETEDESRSE